MSIYDFFQQHSCSSAEREMLRDYLAFLRMKQALSISIVQP